MDSGRGAIEAREMPEALGRRALGSLAFSVILLSGDPARVGAARDRPEVACPELKISSRLQSWPASTGWSRF
jgi:hypothetical protein